MQRRLSIPRLLLIIATVTIGLAMATTLLGCTNAGPQNFGDAMKIVQAAREIAQEQGISWHATLRSTGDPGVKEAIKFSVDTGVSLEVHFQGNAQGNEPFNPNAVADEELTDNVEE